MVVAEAPHAAGLQVGNIVQRHEVHAVTVEAVPAGPLGPAAEALQVGLAVALIEHVVLAGDIEHRQTRLVDDLLGVVEFVRLGELADVARVHDERGLLRQRADACDGFPKAGPGVRIRRLVEADVTVAHLDESQARGGSAGKGAFHTHCDRRAAADGPQHARSRPRHALQQAAAAHFRLIVIAHRSYPQFIGRSRAKTRHPSGLFPAQAGGRSTDGSHSDSAGTKATTSSTASTAR